MVNGVLFKWEDSAALRHHCGFCDRPLSHPGAKSSCFGTHAEPCHRYHQMLFMRLRGHTCNYCIAIDEAHHRRHKDIAAQLRAVYESAGETEWTIIPADGEDRSWASTYDASPANREHPDGNPLYEDSSVSRRERKDAKCLLRAAGRSRVITQEEIKYIDSVIHSVEGITGVENISPRNPEEIEEIERHLKYNAKAYTSHTVGRVLNAFAQLPDVDIDFDAEIERIWEAFRITELTKRNTRTRGLQGKELKAWIRLVNEMKKAVVEDLVRVKLDNMEIRMRRAGYLRYTNKTVYGIVEDRYADKDWKTGEKYTSNTSDDSELVSSTDTSTLLDSEPTETSDVLQALPKRDSDRRHLVQVHKRVNGDDGLTQTVVEPYHTPLLPLSSSTATRKPAVQLRVVDSKTPTLRITPNSPSTQSNLSLPDDGWATVLSSKRAKIPSVKPAWGLTASGHPVAPNPRPINPWGAGECEIPDLRAFRQKNTDAGSPAVQPPAAIEISVAKGPEQYAATEEIPVEEPENGHPVVSQKKAKKYEREAKRKAKKQVTVEDPPAPTTQDAEVPTDTRLTNNEVALECNPVAAALELKDGDIVEGAILVETFTEVTYERTDEDAKPESTSMAGRSASLAEIPVTHNGKHMHWLRFVRHFVADQVSDLFLQPVSGCSHGTPCAFESNSIPDCPYHEPYCGCKDPMRDQCVLVYPHKNVHSCGPFNRLHGQKLLARYQNHHDLKDRVMLLDDDVAFFITSSSAQRLRESTLMPSRLKKEYDDYAEGYAPGPLMEQERQFDRLMQKNNLFKRKITSKVLNDLNRQKYENMAHPYFCYCHETMPAKKMPEGVVECAYRDCKERYFHKPCIKNLGYEKVSRWYCTSCNSKMRSAACCALHHMGEDYLEEDFEQLNQNMGISSGFLNDIRSGVRSKLLTSGADIPNGDITAAVAIAMRTIGHKLP